MKVNQETLSKRIKVANKEIPADLVIKNANVIDVFNAEILQTNVAVVDGYFVGLGDYEGIESFDADGQYMAPSFIDSHVHIESSMVPPSEFAKVTLPHGVTTVIADPHEIGNVLGKNGLRFMLDDARDLPLDFHFMLPSSVPATPHETSGAQLKAEDLVPFLSDTHVLGLGEVMDYPSLRSGDPSLLRKIIATKEHGGVIDGHLAGLDEHATNIYASAGIKTDHECTTQEQALERLRRGMYLLIREGSAAKDLHSLLPVVNAANSRRCLFCTDDKHIDDLIEEGSIDHNLRLSVEHGLDPITAVQMATLNAAECYGLKNKGAVSPGYIADFLLLKDMEAFQVTHVFKQGKLKARHGKYLAEPKRSATGLASSVIDTVHLPNITKEALSIETKGSKKAHIIKINKNQLHTDHITEEVASINGLFFPSSEKDQLKLVVVERHHCTGNIGLGIVKGMGLQSGAMATTVAHDSHNIVAVGTNDEDIMKAIDHLGQMGGGMTVFENGSEHASLPLAIAGLMSDQGYEKVSKSLGRIHEVLSAKGFTGDFNPFLTLSFLTLPVIPSLKITDKGLFDVKQSKHINIMV
ncbi:adenine deaminase [Halobacillus litoralis]|uniref:adenine deaminase n=1 Tax=Halobacillus litoralis TaxID=45668 RepID=UPI001CFE0DE4|nr:adenine deaminase [Halobacillus litoralis]